MKRLAFLAVIFAASAAQAFSLSRTNSHHIVRWYDSDMTIPLQIDADGPTRLRSGDTIAEVNAAIDSAIKSWNDVTCNGMTLVRSGTTTATTNVISDGVDSVDGINRVIWIEQAARYPYSSQVLGVTAPVFYQDGTILEADIVFNGVDDNWAAYANLADVPGGSTNGQAVDIESVVVHELGHLLGLGHVLNGASMAEPPTMTPTVDPQLRLRTLEDNDRAGVCFLYPPDNNSNHACDSNDDCPEFISNVSDSETIVDRSRCVSSACTKIEDIPCGDGDNGDRCCVDNCKGALVCQPLITGQIAYCVATCDPKKSGQCASGFSCQGFEGGSGGVCLSQVILGCSCDTNDDCTSSCACDSDCGSPAAEDPGSSDGGGGCSAQQRLGLWSLLAVVGVLSGRRRFRLP